MKNLSELFDGGSKETQRKKRITFYTICVTLAVLAVMMVFLLVTVIASNINIKPKSTDEEGIDVNIGETTEINIGNDKLYSGNLLALNHANRYNGDPQVFSMQECETRPKTDNNTNAYTVSNKTTTFATQETIDAFNKLVKDFYAKTKNDNIKVVKAYNPDAADTQDALFSAGTTLQLEYFVVDEAGNASGSEVFSSTGDYAWVYNNAAKYGFVNVTVDGKASAIFRFVGIEHATAMVSRKLSVDAYIEWLKANTSPEAPLASKSGNRNYAIYYIAANGNHVVPAKYEYTVSGNNTDGFIITVKLPSGE